MTIIPFPFLTISPARDWSSFEWGSVASRRRAQISASSIAARVRRAENFSIPTSRLPGLRRPAVSRISRDFPLYLTSTRLTSRVVPWRLETRACCFLPRELKRLDLPTLGRPMRANFIALACGRKSVLEAHPASPPSRVSGANPRRSSGPSSNGAFSPLAAETLKLVAFFPQAINPKIADFNSLIPCPVVAEMRKAEVSFIPRERNSEKSSEPLRSDLLRRRKTGFFDFRASFAIRLSFSEG